MDLGSAEISRDAESILGVIVHRLRVVKRFQAAAQRLK